MHQRKMIAGSRSLRDHRFDQLERAQREPAVVALEHGQEIQAVVEQQLAQATAMKLDRDPLEAVAAIVEPTEVLEARDAVRDHQPRIDAGFRELRREIELQRRAERVQRRAGLEAVIEHRDRQLQRVGDIARVEATSARAR